MESMKRSGIKPYVDHWTRVNDNRYVRSDGAVAMWDRRSPNPNPALKGAMMWTAWEPDPSESALSMSRKGSQLRWPRRFRTSVGAMIAVDKAFPL